MSSQRQTITVDGVKLPAGVAVAVTLIHSEKEDEADDRPECPMCGESYECGYTTHLQRCEPR